MSKKKIMETGQEIFEDIKGGTPFKAAVNAGAGRALERGKADVLRKLSSGGKIKRRRAHKKGSVQLKRRITKRGASRKIRASKKQNASAPKKYRKRRTLAHKKASKRRKTDYFA